MFPFSDEDLQEPVNNIISKKISPMLARDGGAIELLEIKNAKVLVVGTGGLGAPVILYLAAAGVGTIGLIDFRNY